MATPEQVQNLNKTIAALWKNSNSFIEAGLAVTQSGEVQEGQFYNIKTNFFEGKESFSSSTDAEASNRTFDQKSGKMANCHLFDRLMWTPEQAVEGNNLSPELIKIGQSAAKASNQNLDNRVVSMVKGVAGKLIENKTDDYRVTANTGLKVDHLLEIDQQAGDSADIKLQGAYYLMNSRTRLLVNKDKIANEKFLDTRGVKVSDKISINDITVSGTAYKEHTVYLVAPGAIQIRGGNPQVKYFDDSNSDNFKKGWKYMTLSSIGIESANWKGDVKSQNSTKLEDIDNWDFVEGIEDKHKGIYLLNFLIPA